MAIVELRQSMRQSYIIAYRGILEEARIGKLSLSSQATLNSRIIGSGLGSLTEASKVFNELSSAGTPVVCLMPSLKQCNEFNKLMLEKEELPVFTLTSIDSIDGIC